MLASRLHQLARLSKTGEIENRHSRQSLSDRCAEDSPRLRGLRPAPSTEGRREALARRGIAARPSLDPWALPAQQRLACSLACFAGCSVPLPPKSSFPLVIFEVSPGRGSLTL